MKIWETEDSRSHNELKDLVEEFTSSRDLQYDQQLLPYDILGSIAHVRTLEKAGVLTSSESSELREVLAGMLREDIDVSPGDEDVHSKVESVLISRLGDLGKKVHTGRSRNDQVLVDIRLFTKEALHEYALLALDLAQELLVVAREHSETPMVGYTHMRKAMPSSVGLWACSYLEGILDDLKAVNCSYTLSDQSPLGAAAGYGVPLELDREFSADLLGFASVQRNTLAAMNSRGKFEFNLLSSLGLTQLDLSRFAQDLILFSGDEMGFFSLPDEFTTGSSIMPQKANPDVLELIRGRTSEMLGAINQTYGMLTGLPSGYSRDLQPTKKILMEGLSLVKSCLEVAVPLVSNLEVNEDNLVGSFRESVFATDSALKKVREGKPFRAAYREVKSDLQSGDTDQAEDPSRITEAIRQRSHLGGPGNLGLEWYQEEIDRMREEWQTREKVFKDTMQDLVQI